MDAYRLGLVATRIHYFQLVARLGSIRQAALALNVAPSSVSRILRQLEEEIGTPLFDRVRQRLKLTSAGELLLYHAKASLSELSRACAEINDLHGLHRGTVSVAVVESVARGLLPAALEAFWSRHPAITVDVKVMASQQAANAVAEGECDLAVLFDVRVPRTVRRIASVSLPIGVLALPDSDMAKRTEIKLFDLANLRVILSDASLTLGASVEEALNRSLVDLSHRSRTNSIGLMVELARRNLGLVLQTRVGVEQELAEGSLVFVPLSDSRLPNRKLLLLSRSAKEMSDAASALGRLLEQSVEQLTQAAPHVPRDLS
ncbi:LysR family transcriptional regulator [Agrobacterium vitis]|uniref:LysR family transcriptional regulator n=1 Tax=Rhizobium/Agrobacterium group TaxID=227290 RepID=UPI0008DC1111|nr:MULTISPECIES: LysR family transcriptional regulator [Rhizobium/Agrobacterium group]MCF1432770.1 LysR family transcriptional regulator [Allorhizobium ampelinum]MCF1472114.1 LysR family transcriptional regulator [Allorhizobium ampelinum]MUO90280.1 LysR family transcriptional regulator [Agrobacterium vitis]MUZ51177.1 LysR family transcriptional regulator [Agrobacterium vitis]MUZ92673.1 LysR family transcriptional regulator [Agrobacterium vitis]